MVNVEYANAYSEVLEILNHIPKSDYNKIPNNMIEVFTRNNNKEYEFNYDVSKTLNEQNVSKIAKTIIAILFRDYWATPTQREKIIAKEKYDIAKMEQEKRETYNPDDIFKKNNKIQNNNALKQNTAIIEYKEESSFKKLINRIMIFLHIKKEN